MEDDEEDGDDEEEGDGTAIAMPKRSDVKQVNYPTVQVKGVVTDLSTGNPIAGVQLHALGYDRYSAMTDENGAFAFDVPSFATALYVHSPEYLSQQVAI